MPNQHTADSIERARAATVRLRVHDPDGYGTDGYDYRHS